MKLEFSRNISKNPQISNLMKNRPMLTELFFADRRTAGRTDRHDEANGRSSANAPTNLAKEILIM
jgi:hypothetical protein